MDQTLGQLIGTKRYVLCILLFVLNGGQHHVLVLIGRIMELARLDRTRHPLLRVSIGCRGHLLAAQFVFALALLVLYPLVVLHRATDRDCLGADTELSVGERIFGCSHCGTTDQLAIQRGILLVGILHLHIGTACLFEHLLGLHGATFVPPQQCCTCNKQQKTTAYCLK